MAVPKKASSSERRTLLPTNAAKRPRTGHPFMRALHAVLFVTLLVIAWHTLAHSRLPHRRPSPTPSSPTWPESLRSHCADIAPIASDEFLARQTALAEVLHNDGNAVFIAEPGASAGFFANLSGSSWGLSERPLLLIVSPDTSTGEVTANITILTPTFEETRAKGLALVGRNIKYVSWAEYENPFEVALGAGILSVMTPVYVDGMTRQFITAGFQAQGAVDVQVALPEIRLLRERKSPAEIEILKCVNEATVLAIRAVRERMHIGSRESEVRAMMADALSFAGLSGGSAIVLFGENAALPHGSGSDRELGPEDFALIDTGGALHGYVSDVTRTFALQETKPSSRQLDLWNLVHAAQARALATAGAGVVAKEVDAAARSVIADAGLGKYFTHRLGHGIGLEVHEAPYLVGGSKDVLRPGHTFSDEPGVYIEGEVGVRLEDCFYVDEDGSAVYLTEGTGGQAMSPWLP